MRKNKLFTALAAAALLVGTGAEVVQTTNPTIVQAAKKSKKKAKKSTKKTKTYTITLKRKPTYYETVVTKQNGQSVAQFKKFKNSKITKKFKLKKGSKIRVLQSVTTYGGDKYYALGYVMVGKKKHSLYIKDSDVKSHSKGIPNVGKKADTSKQNQSQTVTLKNPTVQEYLETGAKSIIGTIKQDTDDLYTIEVNSDKTSAKLNKYKSSDGNTVKWSKGKQFKIYAQTTLSFNSSSTNEKKSIPFYVTILDENNPEYLYIPAELVDLPSGTQSSDIISVSDFNNNFTTWRTDTINKEKQDYIAEQKAKQEQEAAAKKAAAKKTTKSKKKSTKKSKKSKRSSKKATKKAKKTSKK